MRILLFNLIISFGLLSCVGSKYPTGAKEYEGVVMSCKADSTVLITDTEIKLQKVTQSPTICTNCKYSNCDEKPIYYDFVRHWPGMFTIKFNEKKYYYLNNSKPHHPEIKYGEDGYGVQYDLDYGDLFFNKSKHTLTFVSMKYNVTRKYSYSYSKFDGTLILIRQ